MVKAVLVFLIAVAQVCSDPYNKINRLIARIDQVENVLSLNNPAVEVLSSIKANLFFNLQYHDGLNWRELENIYECYLNEFKEVVSHQLWAPTVDVVMSKRELSPRNISEEWLIQVHLAENAWKREVLSFDPSNALFQRVVSHQMKEGLNGLSKLNMAVLQLEDLRMIINGETPKTLAEEIVSALRLVKQRHIDKTRIGEFLQAVDTFAHFIQTRLQHTVKHSGLLAQISTTLLKAISPRCPNITHCLDLTASAVQNLAHLSQNELEVTPEAAHVELFIGGFSNLLLITRNLPNKPEVLPSLEFALDALIDTIQSVFPGTVQVKQAMAIEALYFKQTVQKFNYTANFNCLRNLHTIRNTQTSQIIEEITTQVRQAAVVLRNEDFLHILQGMKVRVQNIFRMSHENNLQVLFLHICSTSSCVGLECEKWIRQLVIDSYDSAEESRRTMVLLLKILDEVQRKCIKRILHDVKETFE
ncbi:hypothetical protein RI129_012284 [Pyrocoelia pectoralis]|uniref:Uncharacterized protein n=1 Tax=Pyrocoelia pectoralis TaxID=417401 RepID=A0AAN7UZZ1_9COLE